MSPAAEQLFLTVQTLPRDERVELVAALVADLDGQPALDESTWEEIRRRSAEYDAGGITPVPWSVVLQRARDAGARNG